MKRDVNDLLASALTGLALLATVCVLAMCGHQDRTDQLWYCHSNSVDVIGKDFSKCPVPR